MNALRKQFDVRSNEALARFSATLDASAHDVMESIDFIAGDPAPANPDSKPAAAAPEVVFVQRRARQLAALVNVIGVQFGGDPENLDEMELVSLAADLAAQLHASMEPLSGRLGDAYSKTGQLAATTYSMCTAISAVGRAVDDDAKLAAADHFGWLQDVSDALAGALVASLQEGG